MTGKKKASDERTARLEAALKANLKRRKTQARARRAMAETKAVTAGNPDKPEPDHDAEA